MSAARRTRAAGPRPGAADPAPLKRVRYAVGMVLGVDDFETEQRYVVERLRRHHRWLHGFGVVTGLGVTIDGDRAVVAPGFALDCNGDEVVIAEPLASRVPARGERCFVLVLADERPVDLVPVPGEPGGEADLAHASRVLECARVVLAGADPAHGHRRAGGRWCACGVAHGVAVARLVRGRTGWRVDSRFRVRRAAP